MTKINQDGGNGKVADPLMSVEPAFDPEGKEPVGAACRWIRTQAEHGVVKGRFARQRISAVRSYAGVLEEMPTIAYMLELIKTGGLRTRWANKKEAARATAHPRKTTSAYDGRVSFLLNEYLERSRAGSQYDEKRLKPPEYSQTRSAKLKLKNLKNAKGSLEVEKPDVLEQTDVLEKINGVEKTAVLEPVSTFSKAPPSVGEMAVSLGGAGIATLKLPFDAKELNITHLTALMSQLAGTLGEFSTKDAGMMGARLATRAADFDPTKAPTQQMFA